MRRRAIEEESELGESVHIMQRALEQLEERRREEPLAAGVGEACIADLTCSRIGCERRTGGQSFKTARGER